MILLSEYQWAQLLQAVRELETRHYDTALALLLQGLQPEAELSDRDVYTYGKALDALEDLHKYNTFCPTSIRECGCQQAIAWRAAHAACVRWRLALGLPVYLEHR